MIILRYFSKEIFKTFIAVTGILLVVALTNKFSSLIARAAMGELPTSLLFTFIGLQIPELLAFLMPLGLFLAYLLALGKLYVDQEMTVYFACGLGWRPLIQLTLKISAMVMILSGFLSLWAAPYLADIKEQIVMKEAPTLMLKTLMPGKFNSLKGDKLIFYVADLENQRRDLSGIFIAEEPTGTPSQDNLWVVLTAHQGQVKRNENGYLYFKLTDGRRYEGLPGALNYSIVNFKTYGRLIDEKPLSNPEKLQYHRNTPTIQLWGSPDLSNQAELQWRFAIPLSAVLLALLALPLAYVPPRAGRFARLLPGIIIFIVYYNFLTLSKRWVAASVLPPWIGLWWVHGIILLAIIIGLYKKCRN